MDWFTLTYQIIRGLFVVLDAALLAVLILAVKKGWEYRPPLMQKEDKVPKEVFTLSKALLKDRWDRILSKIGGTQDSLKLAIIDADKLVDELLKDMRFEGEHMADRLEQITKQNFSTIDRLWRAHKIRNRLVHEPDFKISKEEAEQIFNDYEAFLKEAEAI